MAEFTKEQLVGWANILIEETHTDISISRTDAHAESYRAQLALLEIALASLTAEPEGGAHFARFDEEDDQIIDQCSKNQPDSFPLYRLPLLEGLK